MKQYHQMLKHVLDTGVWTENRTGIKTLSTFGYQMRFDLEEGFPLLTTKKMHLKSIIHELLWFIEGRTNIRSLQLNGVRIWDEWADEQGNLGPVYGHQWRSYLGPYRSRAGEIISYSRVTTNEDGTRREGIQGVDQLQNAVERIRKNQDCRRNIVSAWNPIEVDEQALPPCHTLFQFRVLEGKVHCQLYQRSADSFLGVPFNIASYALLTMMVARVTGLKPGTFVHTFGDLHIYENHVDQVRLQLTRAPLSPPVMLIQDRGQKELQDFKYEDFKLANYFPYPPIKAEVAV